MMEPCEAAKRQCDICKLQTNATGDELLYGDWMVKKEFTIHFFCLMFSTNLPQRGEDNSGILGFLMRDIHHEVQEAANRECFICRKKHASVSCANCQRYFHFICGIDDLALYEFTGQFLSFCSACVPYTEYSKNIRIDKKRYIEYTCGICKASMGRYFQTHWIYCDFCYGGFTHRSCMLGYAATAGYYLRCLWCNKPEFRERVRLQGIFVPDREAQWEREKARYRDLHHGHRKCNVENCRCPKGRDFNKRQPWSIITCILCGSFGVHYPGCLPVSLQHRPTVKKTYKCPLCYKTERKLSKSTARFQDSDLDTSIFQRKEHAEMAAPASLGSTNLNSQFSEESTSTDNSVVTVIYGSPAVPSTPQVPPPPQQQQGHDQEEQAREVARVLPSPLQVTLTSREEASKLNPQEVANNNLEDQSLPAKRSQANPSNRPSNEQETIAFNFWQLNLQTLQVQAREATINMQGNVVHEQEVLDYTNEAEAKLARLKAIIEAQLSRID